MSSMSNSSTYSSGSYSSPSYGTSTMSASSMADCPAGTTKQADGSCAQTSTTYTDASPSYGYSNDGSYGAEVYRPIRK